MSTTQTQNDIVEDFKVLEEDFEMTLNYLMEIGEKMDDYDEELKSDDNLVKIFFSYRLSVNFIAISYISNLLIILISLKFKFGNTSITHLLKLLLFSYQLSYTKN